MRFIDASIALAALLVLTATPAAAAATAKLQQVEQQLDRQKQQQAKLDATAQQASTNLADLRAKLIQSTQAMQDKEDEEQTLEDKLDDLQQQIADKSAKAAQERLQLARIISALVEIASRPPETLFLQQGTATDHIHRSILLRAILPRIKEQAESTAQDLSALYILQQQMAAQKKLVAAAQGNLKQQSRELDGMIAARQGFLQQTEAQKADVARQLAALTDQAKTLRDLMKKVAPKPRHAAPPAAHGDFTLKWPVSGAVRRRFGVKDQDGVTSDGLSIAAPPGAPVVAPMAGKVVFAGPFRGYGLIVILAHPGGYHSFLAGFGRIDADMGQEVDAGEPLGVMPVTGSGSRPELYFEWRRGDDPVDPMAGLTARRM